MFYGRTYNIITGAITFFAASVLILYLLLTSWSPLPVRAQVGPPNTIQCNQLVSQSVSTGTVQTLLAGQTNKLIAICGWHVTTSTGVSQSFQLIQGTGTNCSTTSSIVTPPFQLTNAAPSTDHVDYATLSLALGANLCVQSNSNNNQIGVWVSQF